MVSQEPFGMHPDGTSIPRIWLHGRDGFAVGIIPYGAAVQSLLVPDRDGRPEDVVLGHDTLDGYLARRDFLGATVGRFANRIANGTFVLDGATWQVGRNDGPHALHGGPDGLDQRCWSVDAVGSGPVPFVTLSCRSPDGDQGFPGTLLVRLTYSLPAPDTLALEYEASTDRPTIVNLTHHGFFDLSGHGIGVLDHELLVDADSYLPVDGTGIPTGEVAAVAGTPFDLRRPVRLGDALRNPHPHLAARGGFDHCWCLHGGNRAEPRAVATLMHPASGRSMTLLTDQPGVQVYSGNQLDGSVTGKRGNPHRRFGALCLEPQGWPDAPNHPGFPPAILRPGGLYRHRSAYRFRTLPNDGRVTSYSITARKP